MDAVEAAIGAQMGQCVQMTLRLGKPKHAVDEPGAEFLLCCDRKP